MVDHSRHTSDDVGRDLRSADAVDVQATFCSTLVDQWIRLGVEHAVIAPGSRSTPMALAIAARPELAVHVVHDERVAGFTALGLGLAAGPGLPGVPSLLLSTSGTAAANFLPAIAEAGLSQVPMIVLTADRPEELRGVGAPQTIDQIELYGTHVRWFHDPGVPEAVGSTGWRQLAATTWAEAASGPVHLNLPFREPLVGTAHELPAVSELSVDSPRATHVDPVPDATVSGRGVILVGGMHGQDEGSIIELHLRTGWPLVADPQSGLRHGSTVPMIDALLRVEAFASDMAPDVIIRIGRPSTSKVLAQWATKCEAPLIQVGGPGRIDPGHDVVAVCSLDDLLVAADRTVVDGGWSERWRRADAVAETAVRTALEAEPTLTEPMVARTVADQLPPAAFLTVSSSMPIRDLEWFAGRSAAAHANRGANGIDGVVSTALGRALGRGPGSPPSFVLIGDLAFVHDSNALVALVGREVDLRIIVVDNGGGGIFSFLPQQTLLEHDRFEQLFGTPLGSDVLALAAAHGVGTAEVSTTAELVDQIGRPGPWVCRVRSDRAENVEVHRRLDAAVHEALG